MGRASRRRRADGRPPHRRPSRRRARAARAAGGRRRRACPWAGSRLGLARRGVRRRRRRAVSRRARSHPDRPRRRRQRLRPHDAAHGGVPRRRPRTSGSGRRSRQPTTPPRAARARRGGSCPRPTRPTAIVYDSDLLAVTGLASRSTWASRSRTTSRSWAGTTRSSARSCIRALTAITRDIQAYGVAAAKHLLAVIDGRETEDVETRRGELTPRGSTGRAPRLSTSRSVDVARPG